MTKPKNLPTLLEMKDEVGFALFNLWKQEAEHHLRPCYLEHAECRHAAEYGFVIRAYLKYKEQKPRSHSIVVRKAYKQMGLD